MKTNDATPQEPSSKVHKTLTVVGIVLCVILIPILIVNLTLIVKSFTNKDEVPSIGGITPLIVLSPSMEPDIMTGDLIVSVDVDPKDIKEDDVISFFDPMGSGTAVVTHKVKEVIEQDGKLFFRTYGINNNDSIDPGLVPEDNIVGRYTDFRIPGAGNVAMFMQTTEGLIVCVFLPMILLVLYDVLRRRKYEKNKGDDMATLMAELERLKAEKAAQMVQNGEVPDDEPAPDPKEEIIGPGDEPEAASEPTPESTVEANTQSPEA